MAELVTALKSVQKKSEAPGDALLTPVAVHPLSHNHPANRDQRNDIASHGYSQKIASDVSLPVQTPEDALRLLRSQPSTENLLILLRQLRSGDAFNVDFTLDIPGPLQAQIISTLVDQIVPAFWSVLAGADKRALVDCLRNITGIGAVVASIKTAGTSAHPSSLAVGAASRIEELIPVADDILKGDRTLAKLLASLFSAVSDNYKRQAVCKEVIALISSGKIVAAVAQAEDTLKASKDTFRSIWLSNGAEYAGWLGRNIAVTAHDVQEHDKDSADWTTIAALFLSRALNFGYPQAFIKNFFTAVLQEHRQDDLILVGLAEILNHLPSFAQRRLLEHTLQWLSTLSNNTPSRTKLVEDNSQVSSFAALLLALINTKGTMRLELEHCLSDPAWASILSISARRATISVLARNSPDDLHSMLEKMVKVFADQAFINHAPILQQESVAQTILLLAAYIHRTSPMALLLTARSSGHMQGISNRIDSSNTRARRLGMVVGTAMSTLVDKEGSKMNFGTEDMQTDEAKFYFDLVRIDDTAGQLADFRRLLQIREDTMMREQKSGGSKTDELPILNGKPTFGPPRPPHMVQSEISGERISEVLDDEDMGDDNDLKPYAKPDSDPEDSDEDATLVNRNKPRAPVYVRDLMRMLADDQNHDRFQMGIKHAAALIRRKANFGSEVKDHAEELAGMLCSLQDPFATEGFDELRLQALIAVLLSDVNTLAPWLSRQVFSGDYSLAQRCLMLSALGLGGRELAGYKNQDDLNPAILDPTTQFPSKRLPPRLHATYTPYEASVKRLEAASKNVESRIIQPMALTAADKSTANLNAVKVRTFSSRLDVERTRRKPPPNQLAKIFGEMFFFPLVGRYQQDIAAYGSGSLFASTPFVLVTFLKTLAILLHASGVATLGIQDISTALWDLLLSLRVRATQDLSVLEAVLFGLLTVLEVNAGSQQRLAQENAKQLVETQQWADLVFERVGGGEMASEGSEEERRIRSLAAAVLVKTREVVEIFQRTAAVGT